MSTFFVDNPDEKIFLFQNLLGCIHSYSSTHLIRTSSWLDWRTLFVKLHTDTIWGQNLTLTWVTFFVQNPQQRIILFHNLLVCIHSYFSPQSIWTSPWLYWKTLLVKLHTDIFIGAKFDNDMSTWFVDNPDQKLILFQILLVCMHYYSSTYLIWTGSWLDRKTLFVKLHTDTFWGQNLTTKWVLFS